jgi:DNA-binding NarL/FixJ family response regulator
MIRARPVRVVVADDHTFLRQAIRDLLSLQESIDVVGEAWDGPSLLQVTGAIRPDVVLLDVQMPGTDALATVRSLADTSPNTRTIVLSMYDDPLLVQEMLRLGVSGYLHKSVGQAELLAAVRAAGTRDRLVTVSLSRSAIELMPSADPRATLSERERQVLTLVAQAMTNRQIAVTLDITEGTVKRHLRNIFEKLGAVSRIDAVNRATAASLIRTHRR